MISGSMIITSGASGWSSSRSCSSSGYSKFTTKIKLFCPRPSPDYRIIRYRQWRLGRLRSSKAATCCGIRRRSPILNRHPTFIAKWPSCIGYWRRPPLCRRSVAAFCRAIRSTFCWRERSGRLRGRYDLKYSAKSCDISPGRLSAKLAGQCV